MLRTLDLDHCAEIAKDIIYQHLFLAQKTNFEYHNMFNLLKKDLKLTRIIKKTINNLFA